MKLDDQIVDAFSLVSLLIAISAAYLAGIWPIAHSLLNEAAATVAADRRRQRDRCAAYAAAAYVLSLINVAIAALLIPLTVRAISSFSPHGDFNTVRVGLVLAELLVASGSVTALVLAVRLRRQRDRFADT